MIDRINKFDKYVIKLGFIFAKYLISCIEVIIPPFKNSGGEKDRYNYKNDDPNLTKNEKFKRDIKATLFLSIGIFFWIFIITILNYFLVFIKQPLEFLYAVTGIFFIFLIINIISFFYEIYLKKEKSKNMN
jgi:hypothetical protein